MFRLAVAQMEPIVNDLEGNMNRMQDSLNSARRQDVDALVVPELVNSGYIFENREEAFSLSEEIPKGPFSSELARWSKRGGLVVAGLCEKVDDALYDSAVIFGGGKHLATYRKIHLFDKEKDWFLPGEEEPPVVEYKGYRFGVIVCFDWAFPELSRILALKGAQVIMHPANLMFSYCPKAMITRSIENWIFTATASRVGIERGTRFIGHSQITDPRGHVLLEMGPDEPGVSWVDIDPAAADQKMITKRNDVLKDRRPDLYSRLCERP